MRMKYRHKLHWPKAEKTRVVSFRLNFKEYQWIRQQAGLTNLSEYIKNDALREMPKPEIKEVHFDENGYMIE